MTESTLIGPDVFETTFTTPPGTVSLTQDLAVVFMLFAFVSVWEHLQAKDLPVNEIVSFVVERIFGWGELAGVIAVLFNGIVVRVLVLWPMVVISNSTTAFVESIESSV